MGTDVKSFLDLFLFSAGVESRKSLNFFVLEIILKKETFFLAVVYIEQKDNSRATHEKGLEILRKQNIPLSLANLSC